MGSRTLETSGFGERTPLKKGGESSPPFFRQEKAHEHKLFGPVALDHPRIVPGTQWKPSLSQGHGAKGGRKLYVLKVYVPFWLAKTGVRYGGYQAPWLEFSLCALCRPVFSVIMDKLSLRQF